MGSDATTPFRFVLSNVQWTYSTSKALTGSSEPRTPQITGIDAADVECGYCGAQFRAYKSQRGGPGTFVLFHEQVQVFCASCGRSGAAERPHPPHA